MKHLSRLRHEGLTGGKARSNIGEAEPIKANRGETARLTSALCTWLELLPRTLQKECEALRHWRCRCVQDVADVGDTCCAQAVSDI